VSGKMSEDGFDLIADFDSYPEAADSERAASEQLGEASGISASSQGQAGQAMEGSPLTAEAGVQTNKVHTILDDALTKAEQVTDEDAGKLLTAGQRLKTTEDGIAAQAGDIHPEATVPEPGEGDAVPSGRIAQTLSGAGVDDGGGTGGTGDLTEPSGEPDPAAVPSGRPTRILPNDAPENQLALQRENESASTLTQKGYDVEQNPSVPGSLNPDYRIEGRIFDNVAPTTGSARNIASRIATKVDDGQADRIVLNMSDTPVSLAQMSTQLHDWPISGLKEVIAIDPQGDVVRIYP
jgi:hypothetical protein